MTIEGLDQRDDIDAVFTNLVCTTGGQSFRIDVTLTRSRHAEALIDALARRARIYARSISFDDDALADIWERGTAGNTERLARLVATLPLTAKMFDEAVSHDNADVVCAVEAHLLTRGTKIGSPLEGSDRYARIIAERWTKNNPDSVRKLLGYPLSDAGLLNVLRCGEGDITGDWIVGAFEANPASVAVYEKLEADPGHGADTTVITGTGRIRVAQPVDAHLIAARTAWRRNQSTVTYNADVIARVPQMLHVDTVAHNGSRGTTRNVALDVLAQRLTDRFGDNPEAWTLAVNFGEAHQGSIDELIELVAAVQR